MEHLDAHRALGLDLGKLGVHVVGHELCDFLKSNVRHETDRELALMSVGLA